MTGLPLLSLAITLPIIGAVLLMFVPNRDGSKDGLVRNLALGVSLVVFAVTLALWAGFDPSADAASGRGSSPTSWSRGRRLIRVNRLIDLFLPKRLRRPISKNARGANSWRKQDSQPEK